jgi:hypothetical protein
MLCNGGLFVEIYTFPPIQDLETSMLFRRVEMVNRFATPSLVKIWVSAKCASAYSPVAKCAMSKQGRETVAIFPIAFVL